MTRKPSRTKRSAKGLAQRDDRAYAEFEAVTRKLAKAKPLPEMDAERAKAKGEKSPG